MIILQTSIRIARKTNIVNAKEHLGSQKLRNIPARNYMPIKWSMQAKSTMKPVDKSKT